MNRLLPLIFFTLAFLGATAQTTFQQKAVKAARSHSFDPKNTRPDFNARIINLEAPDVNGSSYKSFLMRQKIKVRETYPYKEVKGDKKSKTSAAQPIVPPGLTLFNKLNNGTVVDYSGGIPNDNALAISNDGLLLAGINSVIWAYDLNGDSAMFPKTILSLNLVASGGASQNFFDPKLIYDEKADRFILVYLRNNTPQSSAIIVCFSSTNNPTDEWYVYTLPGNPLDNNRWTDYPAISITEEELFITGNLIIPNVSWQVGFDGSVIWQLKKEDGYNNADSVSSVIYSDIRHNGKFIRNLHPVRGVESTTETQYFLSNRNFDITNDSIFFLKIAGTMDDPNTNLEITVAKTDVAYGVPPNGRQADTDLTDPTKGLQTNDARVLGGITNGEWLQFVANTVNPATGFAAIYHGHITGLDDPTPTIRGTIIGDTALDFGYPNIAYTGNEDCDYEAIIGFDYTSPNDFPGVGAIYFGNDSAYSDMVVLKAGENYTNRHSDSYERWGDYFGIQRKFNEPGSIWTAGYYGTMTNRNATWLNEVISPDEDKISVHLHESGQALFCKGELEVHASGGVPPYVYSFNEAPGSAVSKIEGLCDGDTVRYTVQDDRGCTLIDTLFVAKTDVGTDNAVYPNPFSRDVAFQFNLDRDRLVSAYVFDLEGKLVAEIIETNGQAGLNELFFDLLPLRAGVYVLKVVSGDDELLVEKIVKNE